VTTIRRRQACKRSRQSVSTSPIRFFQAHGIDAIGNDIACTAIANDTGGIDHMSGFGTKRTFECRQSISAFGIKADIAIEGGQVHF
jgi:hypothetical protein